MRPTYTATAARSGRWWALAVPELGGVFTQARRLDQAEAITREAIALILETPEDSFDVAIEPQMESLGDLRGAIEDALHARAAAEAAQEASSTAMRRAVRGLRGSGYTARDAGILLGVSNQRISQLERSGGVKAARSHSPRSADR
jgi:predicted RNase H-like HicB family nuclease